MPGLLDEDLKRIRVARLGQVCDQLLVAQDFSNASAAILPALPQ